jgi:ATP-dependent DNA ligase
MMGKRQVQQDALFYEFSLERHVGNAPEGDEWLHEIKFDGYRMHGRIERGDVRLLTRTGLNWTDKYRPVVEALAKLPVRSAYLDGELCGVRPDGTTSFSMMQAASDAGNAAALAFFLFDCLYLDGEDLRQLRVVERKQRLAQLLAGTQPYCDTAITRSDAARNSTRKRASCGSRASSQNAPIRPMRRATAVSGSRPSASIARNSLLWAGPILRVFIVGEAAHRSPPETAHSSV